MEDIIRDGPHKWFRSLTEVTPARETGCAEEYKWTHVKTDERTNENTRRVIYERIVGGWRKEPRIAGFQALLAEDSFEDSLRQF